MRKKLLITMTILAVSTLFLAGCTKAVPSQSISPNSSPIMGNAQVSPSPAISSSPSNTGSEPAVLQSDLDLKVTAPSDAAVLTSDTVTVTGQTLPGATVTVNDEVGVADNQGNFSISISLEDGPNAIDVIATGDDGNQGEVLLMVNVDLSQSQLSGVSPMVSPSPISAETGILPLTVATPADGADISLGSVVVKGKTAPGATVNVNDQVDIADNNGDFSITVELEEGPNALDILAFDDAGNQGEVILMVNAGTGA